MSKPSSIRSTVNIGLDVLPVEIETDISNGLPAFIIVGLASKAVDEAKERVRSAIKNSNLNLPTRRITVNLAPADLPKSTPAFDLPIAIGILAASGQIELPAKSQLFLGELALDGRLKPVNGILNIVSWAQENGFKEIYVPAENANEAGSVKEVAVYPVNALEDVILHLKNEKQLLMHKKAVTSHLPGKATMDFADIKGQSKAKRALEIAAAGGHNVLFEGPPGSGKTLLAQAFAGVLPDLTPDESLEVSRIYSVTGMINKGEPIVTSRPFRSPHHTISHIALIGGGAIPKPGEVSLAHRGVLFLDEFGEFPRQVLEVLRQPMEDGIVSISRANGSQVFPADFILLAAQNPCPCGNFGQQNSDCSCQLSQIIKYQKKLSGPILDRIDIFVSLSKVETSDLISRNRAESSREIKARVEAAKKKQIKRLSSHKTSCNSRINALELEPLLAISPEAKDLLTISVDRLKLSARSYYKIQKIARTIADLESSKTVETYHVGEALQFRRQTTDQLVQMY